MPHCQPRQDPSWPGSGSACSPARPSPSPSASWHCTLTLHKHLYADGLQDPAWPGLLRPGQVSHGAGQLPPPPPGTVRSQISHVVFDVGFCSYLGSLDCFLWCLCLPSSLFYLLARSQLSFPGVGCFSSLPATAVSPQAGWLRGDRASPSDCRPLVGTSHRLPSC